MVHAFRPLCDKFGNLPSISVGGVVENEGDISNLLKIVR